MASADEIIDWEQLHDLSGDDPDFEQELLVMYVADTLQQLELWQQAWSSQDLLQIRQVAHHIKGASANVGATALAQQAAEAERAAKGGTSQALPSLLQALQEGIATLQALTSQ